MELELILTELLPVELSHFWQFFLHCRVWSCVISSSYSFQWMFLRLCRHIVDILKMCMWVFDGARIDFDRITAFQTYLILAGFLYCKHGNYKVFLFL